MIENFIKKYQNDNKGDRAIIIASGVSIVLASLGLAGVYLRDGLEDQRESEQIRREKAAEVVAHLYGFESPEVIELGSRNGVISGELRFDSDGFCFVTYQIHPEDNNAIEQLELGDCKN